MTTLILVCVFGVSKVNPTGMVKHHVLTSMEQSRISAFDRSINDSCEECDEAYEATRHRMYAAMCRKAFKGKVDLVYLEATTARSL